MDLTVTDDQGQPWDFSKHECREKARQLIHKTKPLLLVGSPMCTWFSLLQNLNKKHMSPEDWNKGYRKATEHIKFVFELYDIQVRSGRYFLHERPATATSWRLPVVTEFCARYPHLYAITMDMCQFGMTTPNTRGEPTPAKKPTRWLTNSPCLAEELERHCPGTHTHEPLMGGRAKAAPVYPPKLCAAIVTGFTKQLKLDTAPAQVTPPFNGGVGIASLTPQSEGERTRADDPSNLMSGRGLAAGTNCGGDRTQARKPATGEHSEAPVFNLEILQVDADDTKVDLEDDQWIAEDDGPGGSLPAHLVLAARKRR